MVEFTIYCEVSMKSLTVLSQPPKLFDILKRRQYPDSGAM